MKFKLALTAIVALGFLAPIAGYSATEELLGRDKQLSSIETVFSQIEAAKTTDERDKLSDNFENQLSSYAKGMLSSYDAAVMEATLSAKSQGKEGGIERLKAFEDLAVRHEVRLKALEERGKKLLPRGGSLMVPHGKVQYGWLLLDKIGDFFVSPAEAAIALSIWNPCHTHPAAQPACNNAIASGVTQTAAAQSTFNSCWGSKEGVRPKWWRAILRAGCVTALGVRLA